MLISKFVTVAWNGSNKKRYQEKGYVYTGIGLPLTVSVDDLATSSHAMVDVKCDYCGCVLQKRFQTYNQQHHDKFGDACGKCQPLKNKLVCMDKYGVDNGAKTEAAKQKTIQTSMDKYGVPNPAMSTEVRKKISLISKSNAKDRLKKARVTNIQRYGHEYAIQNDKIKLKYKQTMLARYGVEHPKKSKIIQQREKENNNYKYGCDYYLQTDECKQRIIETNMRKYGYKYTLQVPDIREKGIKTLLKNGKCYTSRQQITVYKMCVDMFGSNNVKLNAPLHRVILDVLVDTGKTLIDVEYDGEYWHQDHERDRRRDEFVKGCGYKVLRIIGGRNVPTKEQLHTAICHLDNGSKMFYKINLNI